MAKKVGYIISKVLSKWYKKNILCAKFITRGDYLINTDIEFRKGILFVRINNKKDEEVYIDNASKIKKLISKIGIKYLVLNFNEDTLDNDFKIKLIINKYKELQKNSGKLLLCGNVDISICNDLYIDKIENEIDAFNMIE